MNPTANMGAYVRPYRPIQASHGAETHVGSDAKCGLCVNLHDEIILIIFAFLKHLRVNQKVSTKYKYI